MRLTDSEIWAKAKSGDSSILSDPRVSELKHEDGWTPLHELANKGVKEAWFHPDFDKVGDKKGRTPKDWWFQMGHKPITCTDFIGSEDN